jgi:hypothetical protein
MNGMVYLLIAEMLGPQVTVTVFPRYAIGRTTVRAIVRVEPHTENRVLVVTLDGPHYRMRRLDLDGAEAKKMHEFSWPEIGPGEYVLTAEVYDGRGKLRAAARPAEVCVAGADVVCGREDR